MIYSYIYIYIYIYIYKYCSIITGLNPNIIRATKYTPNSHKNPKKDKNGKLITDRNLPTRLFQEDSQEIYIHPSSLIISHVSHLQNNSKQQQYLKGSRGVDDSFLVFHKKVRFLK